MSVQLEILTSTEAERLATLEAVVTAGAETYIEIGNALLAIRDERLYRQSHARFGDYLRERWDLSRSRGYQLIDAARTAASLVDGVSDVDATVSTIVDAEDTEDDWKQRLRDEYTTPQPASPEAPDDGLEALEQRAIERELPPPANEAVARRLAATERENPGRARAIWQEAVDRHGPGATAEQVAAIATGREPEVVDPWQAEAKAFLADVRRAVKSGDPKDARRALWRWRSTVYQELDRIAKADQ